MAEIETDRAAPPPLDDWPAKAAGTIVRLVDQVSSKTTGPALTAARGVVYGTLAAIIGTAALVLASVLVLRVAVIGIENLLGVFDADDPGRSVWIAEVLVGALFLLLGWISWRKAWRPAD